MIVEIIGKIQIGEQCLYSNGQTGALQRIIKEMNHPILGGCQIEERSAK